MNNYNKRCLSCLLVLIWILGAYCRPHHDGNDVTPAKGGVIYGKGTPAGEITRKRIGVNGGTIATTDGRLTITIPAGALPGDTTIEIQPIINTNPAGNGLAYRLTPHGKIFQKPVSISFSYIYGEGGPKVPQVQGIAYQDDRGVWQSVGTGSVDTVAKKATVLTNHFSDWSQFEAMRLIPDDPIVLVGDVVKLKAVQYLEDDDLLVPLDGQHGKDAPLGSPHDLPLEKFKNWRLSGIGKLSPDGASATYEAPKTMNTGKGSAAVSIELNTPQWKILLISNITVIYEGIVFRINGGDWIHFTKEDCSYDTQPFKMLGQNNNGAGVSIIWEEANKPRLSWGSSIDASIPGFIYTPEGGAHFYTCVDLVGDSQEEVASPGYLEFNHFPVNGEKFLSGSFLIEKGVKMTAAGDKVATARIEGYFSVPAQ